MEALGIDWKILFGQLVTFGILFLLLKRFAFKPFLEILEKRRVKIEEGIKKSEELEMSLQETRASSQKIKEKGEQDAREVVKEAEKRAQEKAESIVLTGHEERDRLLSRAKDDIAREAVLAKKAQERENIEKVFLVAEKFIKEKIDQKADKKIIERMLSNEYR